jgi:hypothetical protein
MEKNRRFLQDASFPDETIIAGTKIEHYALRNSTQPA